MKTVFTEDYDGIIGLKKKGFIAEVIKNEKEDPNSCFWVAPLMTTTGDIVGYYCSFSDDDSSFHLRNDKGVVRSFKSVESAMDIYRGITLSGGNCLTHIMISLH